MTFHRVERCSGSFSRTVTLPCNVIEKEVAAEYTNGVLSVVLPKSEDVRPRKVQSRLEQYCFRSWLGRRVGPLLFLCDGPSRRFENMSLSGNEHREDVMVIIGIDLETSNSAAAVLRGGRPVIIRSAEGISLGGKAFFSYVAILSDGQMIVGEPARRQATANPEGTATADRHTKSSASRPAPPH